MIPTIAEIRDQILADIQSELSLTAPLPPRSVWGILATAVAGALALVYRFAQWTRRQIFTTTADRDALILRGQEYGLTPTAAVAWQGTADATGTDGTALPQGTLFQFDSIVYRTRSTVEISGTTSVSVEALQAGATGTRENADVLEIVTPISGINKELTVTATTTTGEDAETTAAFRARLAQRQRNVPQGGAIPDWIRWTLEVPGIAEAKIDRPAAGSITTYPLLTTDDPTARIPGSTKLTEVLDYITDDRRSPIRAAAVNAVAPTELNFDVDISDLSPNTATVRSAIEDAITAHLYSRRPKQYSDEADPADVVSAARLTGIAINAGAQVATVDLKNAGGTSITDYELEINELAKLRTLTWV